MHLHLPAVAVVGKRRHLAPVFVEDFQTHDRVQERDSLLVAGHREEYWYEALRQRRTFISTTLLPWYVQATTTGLFRRGS
jgi:hypothetical protein